MSCQWLFGLAWSEFQLKKKRSLYGDCKITLCLQNFKLPSMELTKRVLSYGDFLPIKGTMQISSFLEFSLAWNESQLKKKKFIW